MPIRASVPVESPKVIVVFDLAALRREPNSICMRMQTLQALTTSDRAAAHCPA
jgi:hypothetical protein